MTSNLLIGFPDTNFDSGSVALRSGTANLSLEHLITGSRNNNVSLDTAIYGPWETFYSVASGSRRAEFLAIIRADLLRKSGATTIGLTGSQYSRTLPSSISGLQLWLDATYNLGVDSSRLVSHWGDRSSNSHNATQSTGANKPLYSRADNKENLLTYSEDFSNAAWVKTRSTITSNATKNGLNFTDDADKLVEDTSTNTHYVDQTVQNFTSGVTYRVSVYVKSGERTRGTFQLSSTAFAANPAIDFNLGTGTITGVGGSPSNYTITSIGNSWYRLSFEKTAGADGAGIIRVFLADSGGANSYTGDGTSGMYVWGAQAHSTAADSTYCKSEAARQFRGVNGRNAIVFADSTHYMSLATYSALGITGDMTIFAVIRPLNVAVSAAPQTQFILSCATGSTRGYLMAIDGSTSNAYFATHFPSSSTTINYATDSAVDTAAVLSVVKRSGTDTVYLNNTSDGTGSLTDAGGSITFFNVGGDGSGRELAGYLCELLIWNKELSSGELGQVYEYLNKRWKETPVAYTTSLDTETLVGPRQEDWIYKGTASSSYAYWFVWAGNNDTSTYTHSKEIFGEFFDFGRDPMYSREVDSEIQSTAQKRPAYRFEMMWDGISNDKRNEFLEDIGRYHRDTGVILYCDTNLWPLLNNKMMHCRIDEIDVSPKSAVRNSVRIVFQELI